jgi:hypothetical protein
MADVCGGNSMRMTRRTGAALVVVVGLLVAAPGGAVGQDSVSDSLVMPRLAQYIGTWRAEDRVDASGRVAHFVYTLSWFDAGHTIVEMHIADAFDDGERRTLWKGFKAYPMRAPSCGRRPMGNGGRSCRTAGRR